VLRSNTAYCVTEAQRVRFGTRSAPQTAKTSRQMKDRPLVSSLEPSGQPAEARLDSWKEIATYLNRDVSTVQRWEVREGMPIHRHVHAKRGSVYTFTFELDAWLQSRKPRLDSERAETEAPAPAAAHQKSGEIFRVRRWLILGGVVALCLFAFTYFRIGRGLESTARPRINSLAVLPLKNLSGDKDQDYLADGMTEELIGRLAGIHDLRVVSRTSVMRFKDAQLSVPEIAGILGVDAVVEGSVIREDSRIRVHAQLIRGATDGHLWSEAYDRDLRDVLGLQSEVAESIALKVKATLTGEERTRLSEARPVSPEVYESYLKGLYVYRNKTSSRAGVEESIGYFQNAIAMDPTYAPAYVGLASAYTFLSTVTIGGSPAELLKALTAARKALELDPNLADAHVVLAGLQLSQWHWTEAEAEYRRGLELNPSDASAYGGLAGWLLSQGQLVEAVAWARKARELDPSPGEGSDLGWILFNARRYDEAIREYRSALAIEPDNAFTLWRLGFALSFKHESQEAIAVLERAVSVSDRAPGNLGVLAVVYGQAGRREDALRVLAELKRRQRTGYVPAGAFVLTYSGLADREQTLIWLEQAYKEHSFILLFLKVHPIFDSLRDDTRFKDLLHRVGLDQAVL